MNIAPFLIALLTPVKAHAVGQVGEDLQPGHVLTATAETGGYFVVEGGGLYHTEARRVNALELVTYRAVNGSPNIRFRQYAKDPLPVWAADVRMDQGDE